MKHNYKIPYKYRRLFKYRTKKGLKILILLFLVITFINNFSLDFLVSNVNNNETVNIEDKKNDDKEYKEIKIDPCDLSGKRKANVKVDIGFGDREYYSYTNKYAQVIKVEANELVLQKPEEENSNKRYCSDEAKVKGTEKEKYDEGHIIADSLGGVSNSYNITPEDSYINRKGKQYQMEDYLREQLKKGRKITNFKGVVNYPNELTSIPDSYDFTWVNNGKQESISFENK